MWRQAGRRSRGRARFRTGRGSRRGCLRCPRVGRRRSRAAVQRVVRRGRAPERRAARRRSATAEVGRGAWSLRGRDVRSRGLGRWRAARRRRGRRRSSGGQGPARRRTGKGYCDGCSRPVLGFALKDAGENVALDELLLLSGGDAEGGGGEAVGVAQGAAGALVEDGECVGREDVLGGADAREASADVVGGVVGQEASEGEAVMDARGEGAISPEPEPVLEVGKSDEDQGEQRLLVPLVIEQDVQVVERVLVEQVSLVDEEDGTDALFGEVLDVGADGEEEIAGGGGLRQPEGEAEMAIEVSASDGRILAVDEPEVGGSEGVAQGAQDAGLADARLAGEQSAGASVHGVGEVLDERELGGRQPELGVGDVLGERIGGESEVREVIEAHVGSFEPVVVGARPMLLSSRALGGSNGVRASWGLSRQTGALGRCAFLRGSTGTRTWRTPSCSIHGGSAGSTMHRETVTSLRARNPRLVSQSLPSMGTVESPRTRRRTCTVSASRSFFSSKSSGRGAAVNTVWGALPMRAPC